MGLSGLLRALGESKSLLKGKVIHGKVTVAGMVHDVFTINHLMSMYVKCDCIVYAHQVFDQMPERNTVSWTILISAYSKSGHTEDALECLRSMIDAGYRPNSSTYASAVSACTSRGCLKSGKEIHGRVYRVEQELDNYVSNSLIGLYAKCGMMGSAQLLFDEMTEPSPVSWSSIISGYCQCGDHEEALKIFLRSRGLGAEMNEFTAAIVLGACSDLGDKKIGRQAHCLVIKCGVDSDEYVENGIVNLYVKCGELQHAEQFFSELQEPGLASWAAIVGGYGQHGDQKKAIHHFCRLHSTGLRPNEHTFSSVLPLCQVEEGKQVHCLILKFGFKVVAFVGNALIDLYAKCGFLDESMKIFSEMTERDLVTWNSVIAGHVQWGLYKEAIELFNQMQFDGRSPNAYTYSSVLNLCGDLPAVQWGRQTHCRTIKYGLDLDVIVGTAVVDLYAKCGRLSEARVVFNIIPIKNLVTWNSLLVGYAQHGFGREALEIFNTMQTKGIVPNDITFLGVLSACVHVGLVEEGVHYFKSMTEHYGIIPRIDHYSCMVDLYGRAGQVSRAYEFIRGMPIEPDKVIWRSLLAACKNHTELGMGKHAAECMMRIDPNDSSAYLMLCSLYADAELWEEMANVRRATKQKGFKKESGYSWIEVNNKVHSFTSRDVVHCGMDVVYNAVNVLTVQMLDAGYAPTILLLQHEEKIKIKKAVVSKRSLIK